MGTRHLTCVVKDGEYKVAQYGQWDGYPSGQGVDALDFLRNMGRDKFLTSLAATYQPTEEQIAAWWKEVGHDIGSNDGWVSHDISKKYKDKHPSLSRDAGAKILQMIQDASEPVPLNLYLTFAAESLFCEWAYVVDFDKNTFEVYEGFNKQPLAKSERFYGLTSDDSSGYEPVKLKKAYSLDELPTQEEFLAELEPDEEDDE
ncbi:hypothetical protein [Erwinia sp. V71]|uniref:hypothetical protein n=1 Tax=Erwinia sp. V71 TaxID=3369424 RepID=UPI003F5F23A9